MYYTDYYFSYSRNLMLAKRFENVGGDKLYLNVLRGLHSRVSQTLIETHLSRVEHTVMMMHLYIQTSQLQMNVLSVVACK